MKKIILCIACFGINFQSIAQKPVNRFEKSSKEVIQHFKDMLDKAKFTNPKKDLPCEAYPILKQFDTKDFLPRQKDVYSYLKSLTEGYEKNFAKLDVPIDKGGYSSVGSKALDNLSNAKTFNKFIEGLTGKKPKNLSKNDLAILREYFTYHPLKNDSPMISKPKKFPVFEDCFASSISLLSPSNWKHPNLNWSFETTVTITCDCEESGPGSLNQAKFTFDTAMTGQIDADKISFINKVGPGPVQPEVVLVSSSCCPEEEPGGEASMQLDPNENISLPNQTIGINAGVGFGQDFEEISLCVGGEFLFNATEIGSSPLFVGGNVQVETSSFLETSSFSASAGPTAQLFTPITSSGEVHMTNGINGNIVFGTNDNNGFKDDVTGFTISLNTGLNIQLNNNISLSLIIPVVTHQNLTFESQQNGSTFEFSDTSILLNKRNPVKLGLRFGL